MVMLVAVLAASQARTPVKYHVPHAGSAVEELKVAFCLTGARSAASVVCRGVVCRGVHLLLYL